MRLTRHSSQQKHSDASRPATAPVACHTGLRNGAGGGGNLAAFSKRFFSAQAQASRPKSPLRCPWMRKSAKRASSAVERRALDRMASQITEDVQTLRSQPRPHTAACAAGSAFEAALAYRSRAAPNQAGAATAAGRRHVSGKNSAGMPAGAAPSSFQVFPPVQHQAELQVKQCPSSRRGARVGGESHALSSVCTAGLSFHEALSDFLHFLRRDRQPDEALSLLGSLLHQV